MIVFVSLAYHTANTSLSHHASPVIPLLFASHFLYLASYAVLVILLRRAIILSFRLSLSAAGLTVLPLLNERFANRSITLFVLPPLQYTALNIVCFTSS